METESGRAYRVHVLKDSSPQIFGEVIFVATAWEWGNLKRKFDAECFVLVERGEKRLTHRRLSIAFDRPAVEAAPQIDTKFMCDIALDACKAEIGAMLMRRFDQSKDWNIFALPFSYALVDDPEGQLARLWVGGHFRDELSEIRRISDCEDLTNLLDMLGHLPVIEAVKQ